MSSYDYHSDLAHSIAYPAFPRPTAPISSRIAAFPEKDKEERPASSQPEATIEDERLFHNTLLESGWNSRPRNPWVFGSLAFQLFLLLALIAVVPLCHTDVLPKREILTMLYVPPRSAASRLTQFRASTSTHISKTISVPNLVHKAQEARPRPVDTTGGVIEGVPGGIVGGVPDGLLGEGLSSALSMPVVAKTPEPNKRMRIASRVAEANLIHTVAPTYPPEAGRARIEGTVVLLAVIGRDGTVQDVRVQSGLQVLAQAAIDAVKKWRYRPYLLRGEPIEVDSQITINFTLSKG